MQKLEGRTFNVVQDNIERLKELFPEVMTENKIDIDKLRIALGESVEKEKERYEFTWNGKTEAIQLAQKQTTGTLLPCKKESVNWDNTQNLFIEGDNLEVLRVLQNSYRNKVKVIYIDPPYNTGKDFVYKDDFHDNLKNYKEKNQESMKSNSETNGRYHTDWLNMIYPRLKIARNLLKEDGVIFISIDDAEVSNLKKICDEIFGEENFEGLISWRRRHNQPNDKSKMIAKVSEYIICYAKSSSILKEKGTYYGLPLSEERINAYTNPDNDPKGPWSTNPWKAATGRGGSTYTIETPTGIKHETTWYGNKVTFDKLLKENRVYWTDNGNGFPRIKIYLEEAMKNGQAAIDFFTHERFGSNQEGSSELEKALSSKGVFDNPKPTKLLKSLIKLSTSNDDIVLDFFSGSASTAHALLKLNAEEDDKRKFILVQLPEVLDKTNTDQKAAYNFLVKLGKPTNISEIGKERIRRAGKLIIEENKENKGIEQLDVGFKVFKLDDTNLKIWDEESIDIEKNLLDIVEPVKEGRSQEDIVYEILLKYGVDLTTPIEQKNIAEKTVYSVGMGYLLICLERDLTLEHIEEMAKKQPARIVFYDEGFKNDTVRTNAQQILKRYGVEDIRVI